MSDRGTTAPAAVLFAALAAGAAALARVGSPVQPLLGLALVLALPGAAVVMLLGLRLSRADAVLAAAGTSIAVSILSGMALGFAGAGFGTAAWALALAGLTSLLACGALARRARAGAGAPRPRPGHGRGAGRRGEHLGIVRPHGAAGRGPAALRGARRESGRGAPGSGAPRALRLTGTQGVSLAFYGAAAVLAAAAVAIAHRSAARSHSTAGVTELWATGSGTGASGAPSAGVRAGTAGDYTLVLSGGGRPPRIVGLSSAAHDPLLAELPMPAGGRAALARPGAREPLVVGAPEYRAGGSR